MPRYQTSGPAVGSDELSTGAVLLAVSVAVPEMYSVPIGRKSPTTGLRVEMFGKSTRSLKQTRSPLRNVLSAVGIASASSKRPSTLQSCGTARGCICLFSEGNSLPCRALDASPTVTGPLSEVPGIGVVVPVRLAVFSKLSPPTVGRPVTR